MDVYLLKATPLRGTNEELPGVNTDTLSQRSMLADITPCVLALLPLLALLQS